MWRYLQRRGRLLRAVAAKVLPEACPSDPSLTSCRHHKQGLHNLPAMDLVCCTLIIDDIVLPDGESCMAQLGGGGPQSLFGFQLVSRCLQRHTSVGLAAGVGDDLPDQCKVPGHTHHILSATTYFQYSCCAAVQLHARHTCARYEGQPMLRAAGNRISDKDLRAADVAAAAGLRH